MKRYVLTLLIAIMAGVTQYAMAATINLLVIQGENGDNYYIALNQEPKIKLEPMQLTLTTADETIIIDGTQLINFSWGDKAGIEDLEAATAPTFYWVDDTLHVYGLQPSEFIALYTVDGIVIYQGVADENGASVIGLNGRRGVTIVKTQSQILKFTR